MQLKGQKYITCKSCNERKPIADFYISKVQGKYYASTLCKRCKKLATMSIYYKNRIRKENADRRKAHPGEEQKEFFKIHNNVVYAKLIRYDTELHEWIDGFVPILKCKTTPECMAFMIKARDLSVSLLKFFAREYRHRYPEDCNYIYKINNTKKKK